MIFVVIFVLTQDINVGSNRSFDHFLWSLGNLKTIGTVNTPILFVLYLLQITPVTNWFEIQVLLIEQWYDLNDLKRKKEIPSETHLIFKESIPTAQLPTCSHQLKYLVSYDGL